MTTRFIPSDRGDPPGWVRLGAALVAFGLTFGFVEASVVVYLRALYEPLHRRVAPARTPGDLFPLLRLDQLRAEGPEPVRMLAVELVREAATLGMLAAVGLAVGRTLLHGFAAFLVAFGVWDLAYYAFLYVTLGWPKSLLDWDLLFLLPVPWIAPVLAPAIVATSMIASGFVVLRREAIGRPVRLAGTDWLAVVGGGLILVVAFCWDYRNATAGGLPRPFPWPIFAVGEAAGLLGFGRGLLRGDREGV